MLHIHTSNRLEHLIFALAKLIESSPLPPLIKELIVVQDRGMERWLSMLLAETLGVWSNSHFMQPDTMLWHVFKEVLRTDTNTSCFKREVMVWHLIDILPQFIDQPEFRELKTYLQADEQEIKSFQLAWRIADVFDQYTVYRPNWLFDWENGKQPVSDTQADWQAILWRELITKCGDRHRAKLRIEFFEKLKNSKLRCQRLTVFGISVLPEFHLEVLTQLGQAIDVHIFVMNPCQEYWGDIVTDSEIIHRNVDYLEKGNTLLASMGKIGRNFIDMFNKYEQHVGHEYFESPGDDSLLHKIQTDILNLKEGEYFEIDESIQIHNCHSPLREVEVLHDQLLALFVKYPDLLPKDILVMVADIETYAPFIEAVFDTTPAKSNKIPYSIADRNLRAESTIIDTFFAILELTKGRFTVGEVLAILESEIVQKKFEFTEKDLELIQFWIDKVAIRWGIDKADKVRMNLPDFEENTWLLGLKRLLLGYALPTEMFQGILPYDGIEGSDSLILGRFISFVEKLFTYVQKMRQLHTIPEWSHLFNNLLLDFFPADNSQEIRNALNNLITSSQNFTHPVSYAVIFEYLQQPLAKEEQSSSFLTGRVSFSAIHHSRSIPFKIVCLLGMNDQSFPRPNKQLNFDLITRHPERGDRSRRHNDRYLFLEALLSAREHFYISYVGQSIHDNTTIPPSVLVSELLDYINIETEIFKITAHPLQAFSSHYFNQTSALFSFSNECCTASAALRQEYEEKRPFITTPLATPDSEYKTIELNNLIKFFNNPTAFLLRQRLGIELSKSTEVSDSNEPFEVSGLERYSLNQTLIEKSLNGVDLQEYKTIVKASGQLPHGEVGNYIYDKIIGEIKPFVQQVSQVIKQNEIECNKNFQEKYSPQKLQLGEITIVGNLSRLWQDNSINSRVKFFTKDIVLEYRYAKLKAKDFIQIWIGHLIFNSLSDLPRQSILIGTDGAWKFLPVPNSKEILQNLVQDYYWQGLTLPLLFFPQTSLCFVENLSKGVNKALYQAVTTWQGNDFVAGEVQNDYYQLCFGSETNLLENEQFSQLAQQFFEPMLEYREQIVEL
ncbi:MAG: exodeoxyribonuclease V subunit gamma [Candidatus Marithrix sp.]|nr:exodeoxyribonuclease V subunit gamma [Candidatus Marithrix sp.]